MALRNNKHLFILIGMIGFIVSCQSKPYFQEMVPIPESGWDMDSTAILNAVIDEQSAKYNLFIQTKNTDQYAYQNAWFFIDIISPSGKTQRDTLDCFLADHKGKWFGSSGINNEYHCRHPYRHMVKFQEPGNYTIQISQGMRDTTLYHLTAVGIYIEKIKKITP